MQPTVITGQPPPDAPRYSVAIVGAGACGLVASLLLRDAGIDCVLLERDARPAGSTALSSGFIPAPGSAVQRAAGIDDSAELFAHDIQTKAHGTAAAHLVSAFSRAIGPAIDVLRAQHAIDFIVLDGFLYPGHSVRRMHAVPEKTGAALVGQLERAALAAGADILTQAHVTQLWIDSRQRVTGIAYVRPDGTIEHLRCDALLLACNGFGGNPEMVADLLPEMRQALFAGHAGNDGSAIAWGLTLGARLADLGGYQGHGSWATPQGALITWALIMEGGVQLNRHGRRFHDETQGYSEAAVHVLAQPGAVAWNVFDGQLLTLARGFPDFCAAEALGAVKRCESLDDLASLIGCDATNIIADDVFCALAAGQKQPISPTARVIPGGAVDRVFKRRLAPPFYAVKVTGALFHTQGGLDIDAHCRVLRSDGSPFANLLAAGGAARGVSGNAVWGYLSGNGLLSAVAGGAIAAATLVASLKEPL